MIRNCSKCGWKHSDRKNTRCHSRKGIFLKRLEKKQVKVKQVIKISETHRRMKDAIAFICQKTK